MLGNRTLYLLQTKQSKQSNGMRNFSVAISYIRTFTFNHMACRRELLHLPRIESSGVRSFVRASYREKNRIESIGWSGGRLAVIV